MKKTLVIELVKRLVSKGAVFSAEMLVNEGKISRKTFEQIIFSDGNKESIEYYFKCHPIIK